MRIQAPALMLLLLGTINGGAQTAVSYRVLTASAPQPGKPVQEFDFNVSVDKYLDAAEARNVICALIREKKPNAYDVLSVGIYYKLDRYSAENDGELADAAELRERRLAQYHWSKDSPKDSRRLAFMRDAKGQVLSEWRFNNFDHTKTCR